MKKNTTHMLRFLCLISVLICSFILVGKNNAYAKTIESFNLTMVNPLYEDVITENNLKSESSKPGGIGSTLSEDDEEDLPIYSTQAEAAEDIRKKLVAHEETIKVNFLSTKEDYKQLMVDLFNEALEHTGVAEEGDYLKWGYAGSKASGSRSLSGNVYTYYLTYTVTYYTTLEQEKEVDAIISNILNADVFHDNEKYCTWDKIEYIYKYITSHVTYDHDTVNDPDYTLKYTAYAALVNGTAVCQGYSTLMYKMMLKCGIDCRLVAGKSNGERHSWNIVKLGNIYYYTDPTWDSERGEWAYFLTSASYFERNHTRFEEYTTAEFCQKYPVSEFAFSHNYDGHQYDDGSVTIPPTCSSEGTYTYHCKYCDKTINETMAIDKDAHVSTEGVVIKKATCISTGIIRYTCDLCGTQYEDMIPFDDDTHIYKSIVTEPTTSAGGYTTYTCTICGDTYISDYTDPIEEEPNNPDTPKGINKITAKNLVKSYSTKKKTYTIGAVAKSGSLKYSSSNPKKVSIDNKTGKVTVAAKFIGRVTITIISKETATLASQTKKITFTVNPASTQIKSASNVKGKKLTVKWAKNSSATGYQIQYSTNKNFAKGVKTTTVTKAKTVSKTITKLTKNKTYYVRLRTYKTIGKTRFYASWSKVKTVKIKK